MANGLLWARRKPKRSQIDLRYRERYIQQFEKSKKLKFVWVFLSTNRAAVGRRLNERL